MRRRLLIARALVHRPRLLLLDEPTVGLDPQVRQELWALIDACAREGVSILMSTHYIEEAAAPRGHGGDHVPRQGRRRRAAGRAGRASTPAARRSRSTGRPRAWPRSRPSRSSAASARGGPARACRSSALNGGDGPRGRAPPGEPGGRVRAAHRRGGRLMATEATAAPASRRAPRLGRLERPALAGVLVREIINFARSGSRRRSRRSSSRRSTCSRSASASGRWSRKVGGRDYVEFVGTGTVATAVLFSSVFPAMFGTFVKYKFQRTYDAILAAPVDTEELVTAEALWIAARAGVFGCVPLLVGDVLRPRTRRGGCCTSRSSASSPGSAGRASGSSIARS